MNPAAAEPARKARDERLDFFRGLAMFVILIAHIPDNRWTLWIPARFGFSDATEVFVFCSGFASALAFGAVFAKRGFLLGTARIVFRVWQVYWAHVGMLLISAAILFAIDSSGLGAEGIRYIERPWMVPLFEDTGPALLGLLTLTWVPGLFDILPMYLVILAMVPVVMALHRAGGLPAAAGFVVGVWLLATLGGLARTSGAGAEAAGLASLGRGFEWMNLPAGLSGQATWFFNPFSWQIVFFTGLAFGMGWLPKPPVTRRLVVAAVAVLALSLPLAWHKLHQAEIGYLPAAWGSALFEEARTASRPLWWKTWLGALRYLHFLAFAYLAWVAVGPAGERLRTGFAPPPAPARRWVRAAAAVAVLTIPYAWVEEIAALAPALDRWLLGWLPIVPGRWMGLLQIAHLAALVVLIWAALGDEGRRAATGRRFLAVVPVIRKVGTQSLAVFIVSIPLAIVCGWILDLAGRGMLTTGAVNLAGFAVLVAVAFLAGWFKSQPWRERGPAVHAGAAARPGNGEASGHVAVDGLAQRA